MDHLQKYKRQLIVRIALAFVICGILSGALVWYALEANLDTVLIASCVAALCISIGIATAVALAHTVSNGLATVQQAVLHISPQGASTNTAPKLDNIRLGKDIIVNVITTIYQLANVVDNVEQVAEAKRADVTRNFVANNLPLPFIVLNDEDIITFANTQSLKYLKLTDQSDVIGKSVYTVLDLSFQNAITLDAWLSNAKKNKPVASQTWERVKLTLSDQERTVQYLDMAAYYNRGNPNKCETMLVLFDHTDQYSQDDQAMSLVALSVHELRTPLTLLRGYIEAFEEDLGPMLNAEQTAFMKKMIASGQQLGAFVNNILNIARIEQDGLTFNLTEQRWEDIVRDTAHDMALRAQVRGIAIQVGFEPNLPTVGVDKTSIYEVLVNLLDNAIKYSGQSTSIIVKSYMTTDGMVETIVQDFGVGVPSEAMPNLFDKYYRNHRNRDTVGGTGLGLYLSKAIVGAHGGHIWVKSKEGKGSTFGFTIAPYGKLAAEAKNTDNKGIERGVHGWIKNHTMYRR